MRNYEIIKKIFEITQIEKGVKYWLSDVLKIKELFSSYESSKKNDR